MQLFAWDLHQESRMPAATGNIQGPVNQREYQVLRLSGTDHPRGSTSAPHRPRVQHNAQSWRTPLANGMAMVL
jgi:hypothetical protein